MQRADAEAAKLYEEFAASFSSEPEKPDGRSFVRGGTIQPGSRPSAGALQRQIHVSARCQAMHEVER